MEEQKKKELKAKGSKALIVNVIFFFILFLGIIVATYANLAVTLAIVSVIFVGSILYIYYS